MSIHLKITKMQANLDNHIIFFITSYPLLSPSSNLDIMFMAMYVSCIPGVYEKYIIINVWLCLMKRTAFCFVFRYQVMNIMDLNETMCYGNTK